MIRVGNAPEHPQKSKLNPIPNSARSQAKNHICGKLSVLILNYQGVVSKKADLNCLIEITNPDIISYCIGNMAKLSHHSINSSEFLPLNYIAYRKDREDGYGGVLLAYKITLSSHQLHIDSPCEIVACKFDQIDNPLVICSVYRPPSCNIEYLDHIHMCNDLQSIILTNPSSTMWIDRDLNLPDINWSLNTIANHQYPLSLNECFLDFQEDNLFVQFVTTYSNTK